MVLIRKTKLSAYILLSALLFLCLAFYSYSLIMGLDIPDAEKQKFFAEKIFLLGIAGTLVFALSGWEMIFRSRKFEKSLDKLLVMSRNTGRSPDEGLRKLGKTGQQIADILAELDRIGEMRALRVSALDNLCRIIIRTSDMNAAVVSPKGEIVFCTDKFTKKSSPGSADISGHLIETYVKDRDINSLLGAAVSSHREIQMKDGIIIPVINKANDAVWCFCVFDSSPGGISLAALRENRKAGKPGDNAGRMQKVLGFFTGIRKKKSGD